MRTFKISPANTPTRRAGQVLATSRTQVAQLQCTFCSRLFTLGRMSRLVSHRSARAIHACSCTGSRSRAFDSLSFFSITVISGGLWGHRGFFMAAGFLRLGMRVSLLGVRDSSSSLHPLGVCLSVTCFRDKDKRRLHEILSCAADLSTSASARSYSPTALSRGPCSLVARCVLRSCRVVPCNRVSRPCAKEQHPWTIGRKVSREHRHASSLYQCLVRTIQCTVRLVASRKIASIFALHLFRLSTPSDSPDACIAR